MESLIKEKIFFPGWFVIKARIIDMPELGIIRLIMVWMEITGCSSTAESSLKTTKSHVFSNFEEKVTIYGMIRVSFY